MNEDGWKNVEEVSDVGLYLVQGSFKDNHIPNSIYINYDLSFSKDVYEFVELEDFKDTRTLGVVVANLVASLKRGRNVIYSRKTSFKIRSKKRRKLSVYRVIKAVDYLEEYGYITNCTGKGSSNTDYRVSSYMKATDKFRNMWEDSFKEECHNNYLKEMNVIELRDSKKEEVGYRLTETIKHMHSVVTELNIMNEQHTVRTRDGQILSNIYCRIFNEDFEKGGRYYRADVLGLTHNDGSESRHHLTIDGEYVTEVDFSNLHFRIAAQLNNIDTNSLPLDVYSGIIPDENNKVDRQVVKVAVNMMFNSETKESARRAIQSYINRMTEEDKNISTLGKAKDVIDLILLNYPQFSDILCNDVSYGLRLQNEDSKLATDIIEEFLLHEKPILVVHDSFIVKAEDVNLLCDVMGGCFRVRYDNELPVPVNVTWNDGKQLHKHNINV